MKTLLAAVLCAVLSGCMPHKQYRFKDGFDRKGNKALLDHVVVDGSNGSDLFFVEVDDQGYLWDRGQVARARDFIAGVPVCETPPIVVAFVHGWDHNAKASDDNVQGVKDTLKYLGSRAKGHKIVGVFVGWRGKSYRQPLHLGSFWGRKDAAHRIGASGLSQVFNELEVAKAKLWAAHAGCPMNNSPMMVVTGHSFGGAAVHSAYSQILGERMRRLAALPTDTPGQVHESPRSNLAGNFADLVILFDPAYEAARVEHLTGIPDNCGAGKPCKKMLLAITAENDTATRFWFPLGRWLSTWTQGLSYNHKTAAAQGQANRTAVGHFEPWLTHYLTFASKPDPAQTWCDPKLTAEASELAADATGKEMKAQSADIQRVCGYELQALAGRSAVKNPRFINVRADKRIIDGHAFQANSLSLTQFAWDFVLTQLQEAQTALNAR